MQKLAEAMKISKIIVFITTILFMPGLCLALDHIVISEVLYDPLGTETGGEAVELYNPTGTPLDIGGHVIKTESSATDATIPAGTNIPAGGFYLIADSGWSTLKDNASWPNADHEEAITIANADAGIALVNPNGTIIDAVGWGSAAGIGTGLYEGTPASLVAGGKSLRRTSFATDMNDNSAEFIESVPELQDSSTASTPETGNDTNSTTEGESIELSVSVSNSAPTVESVVIGDDEDNMTAGVQVIPVPEGTKDVTITVQASDVDGTQDRLNVNAIVTGPGGEKTVSLAFKSNTSSTTATYSGAVPMEFYDEAGTYNVTVSANDSSAGGVAAGAFQYLTMAAISIDAAALTFNGAKIGATSEIRGDIALSTSSSPTIRNVGNTVLDVGVYGTDLVDGSKRINSSNIMYSFDNDFDSDLSGTVTGTMQVKSLGLENSINSVTGLGFRLNVPATTQNGNYTGMVTIVAVSG